MRILIGTSGWSYRHWIGSFYPTPLKSYRDLEFYSQYFNTVENNSSFYRISTAATYRKWFAATPDNFTFSLKLNRLFTHVQKLQLNSDAISSLAAHLTNLQLLEHKLGALLIQTPPSLRFDIVALREFLATMRELISPLKFKPDLAIEFRNKYWFRDNVYQMLSENGIAWAIGQSSRYPYEHIVTSEVAYIRFHGPRELFASPYSESELEAWWKFLSNESKIRKAYIYFNNDFGGHAIVNAKSMQRLASVTMPDAPSHGMLNI